MSTIGIFHYKVGGTDGVSLEIDKWKRVLEGMGHTVHLCAGDLGTVEGTLIEELYHHRPDVERLNRNTFCELSDFDNEAAYQAEVERLAAAIERQVRDFVERKGIDFLIPQNVWSVAISPPAAIALARAMRDLQLPALAHHHDFYFDFDGADWQIDDYNRDFRARIGLGANDVLILQATRIVQRKGIELAVDFVEALDSPERRARLKQRGLYDGRPFDDDSRIVLVLAGYTEDATGRYLNLLRGKVERAGIDALFIGDLVGGRRQTRGGEKIYSLWDTYVFADFVTYPSLWEGWGNQFLEALRARLPLMLFEYPVYRADVRDKGFRVVSLGGEIRGRDGLGLVQVEPEVIEAAADRAVELLTDARLRRETVEHNFQVARQHYSLEALRGYLTRLMERRGHLARPEARVK